MNITTFVSLILFSSDARGKLVSQKCISLSSGKKGQIHESNPASGAISEKAYSRSQCDALEVSSVVTTRDRKVVTVPEFADLENEKFEFANQPRKTICHQL